MQKAPYSGNLPYIFVSYSHQDSGLVQFAISRLQAAGYRVWYDEGIEVGTEWPQYIAERIMNCSVFLAFVSNRSLNSQNCTREINFAIKYRKEPVAIYLENVKLSPGMDMQLSSIQCMYYNRFSSAEEFAGALVSSSVLKNCLEGNATPKYTASTGSSSQTYSTARSKYSAPAPAKKSQSSSEKTIETLLHGAGDLRDRIQDMGGSTAISVIAIIATLLLCLVYAVVHCIIMSQSVIPDPESFSFFLGEFPATRLNIQIFDKYWVDLLLGAAFIAVSFFTASYIEYDSIKTAIYMAHFLVPIALALVFVPISVLGFETVIDISLLFENFESYFNIVFLSAIRLLIPAFVGFFATIEASSD